MNEHELTSVIVEAKRAGEGPRPWAWVIRQNGVQSQTSAPHFATSFEALQAGGRALSEMEPHRSQANPGEWT
jgi:hypothetical protein